MPEVVWLLMVFEARRRLYSLSMATMMRLPTLTLRRAERFSGAQGRASGSNSLLMQGIGYSMKCLSCSIIEPLNGSIANPKEPRGSNNGWPVRDAVEAIPTCRPAVRRRPLHAILACLASDWKCRGVRGNQSVAYLRLLQLRSDGSRFFRHR